MRKFHWVHAAAAWCAAGALGCGNGDDTTTISPPDAAAEAGDATSSHDGEVPEAATEAGPPDGATSGAEAAFMPDVAGDSGSDAAGVQETGAPPADAGPPKRLLLSYNGSSQSELAAFGLDSRAIDGRLVYPGFIGATFVGRGAPWLLEQSVDVVARLDPGRPWVVGSSWNVALSDRPDGGYSYSDPVGVVVTAGNKAYVLRYTRNDVAVLDASQGVDAGAPAGTIDLGGQVQAGGDGVVEMSAGVYVASRQILYVLLGNIDKNNVGCNGYCFLCSTTHPTVVGIDVASDKLVDLNGSAPGTALTLDGYSPVFGTGAMAYDAAQDRLIVLETGCNETAADGGVGPIVRREVEELSLFTGASRTLLDLDTQGFPQSLTYIDAHRAIVQLDSTYAWDPTTSALGRTIPNAPDAFAWDGADALLGLSTRYGADGGLQGYDVVSVRIADGAVTKLGADPFTLTGGFLGGVGLWPAP
ncbi:MAG TPA: hypothetical protein VKU41_07330 [Polyangiaceae bacterium]|nr:hypothetical protein [Polyangiaceae bacterium]